ncbi:MAG TPA: hypothetical protein DIW46_10390 [Microbacterium sp.]|nr:hypothetical protein [Microbacterium sp.]
MNEPPLASPVAEPRRNAARGLLVAGTIASSIGLVCSAMMFTSANDVPPEALLIPMMLSYVFAFTWWAVAAVLIIGIVLSIGVARPQPLQVCAAIGMFTFVIAVALLAGAGLFPWPFPPRFG